MRSILIAAAVAAAIGLAGTSGATAAPINAIVIKEIAALSDSTSGKLVSLPILRSPAWQRIPAVMIWPTVVPWPSVDSRLAARVVVRVVPIELRVIEKQVDALPMTFVRQHF